MSKLVNLVRNENMKIYRRLRTWILLLLLVAIVSLGSTLAKMDRPAQEGGWETRVKAEMAHLSKEMERADIKPEEKTSLQNNINLLQYRLDHDMAPTRETIWDGLYGVAGIVVLITLFTCIIAGDSVAGEFSMGTIKLLLIRPVSRTKILLSKYISTVIFGLFLLLLLFISSVVVNGLLYGFQDFFAPGLKLTDQGNIVEFNQLQELFITYGFNCIQTVMFVTMAFMISTVFRSFSMAIGISIFLLFAGNIIVEILGRYDWIKYFLFANIDLKSVIDGYPVIEGTTLSFSITVLVVYYLIFIGFSWILFKKRDVST